MQLYHAGRQLSILRRAWRARLVFARAPRWIIESPMFHVPLPALHHRATHAGLPAFPVRARIAFWEVQVGIRHHQLLPNSAEAKLAVRLLERKRMRRRRFFALQKPFIHTPEVGRADV